MSVAATLDVAQLYAERLAAELGPNLRRLSLFGSRARGEAHPRSDYDLMIVLGAATREARDRIHGLATEVELEYGVDLSTKIVDEAGFAELHRSALPFWRHFVHDERILWPPTRSPKG